MTFLCLLGEQKGASFDWIIAHVYERFLFYRIAQTKIFHWKNNINYFCIYLWESIQCYQYKFCKINHVLKCKINCLEI